ncbi:MAG: sulfatase-like hydrolase/transferase [Planctomycetes bacterium]|nr:sulfatase-like hydrolase/transferase [Planctomycetota bacterium]
MIIAGGTHPFWHSLEQPQWPVDPASQNTGSPFFLYVAYTAPHSPLHAWPEDIAKYQGRSSEGWEALAGPAAQANDRAGDCERGLAAFTPRP